MTAPIPTAEPASLNAGDTAKWLKTLPDYPADDGWALAYKLVNTAGAVEFAATASGSAHLVNIGAATTAAWAPGTYDWRAMASKDGEFYTVAAGRITIAPVFGSAALDARSQPRRMLENVEAMLEGRASTAVRSYEIAGRKLENYAIPDLLTLRDRLRQDVAREDAAAAMAAGASPRGRIQVRYGP